MQKLKAKDAANLHSLVHRLNAAKLRGLPVPLTHSYMALWHKELVNELLRNGQLHHSPLRRPIRGRKF
jgi:hypothetical protein